jgi:hypothetical protein
MYTRPAQDWRKGSKTMKAPQRGIEREIAELEEEP